MTKRTFRLEKLVLNGVYDNMIKLGQKPDSIQLKGKELLRALTGKIAEETDEFLEEENLKELADVHQTIRDFVSVLNEYSKLLGIEEEQLEPQLRARFAEMGGFSKGYYVRTLTLDTDDEWCEYYAARPNRFPEITK